MPSVISSVGKGGTNRPDDVKTVQLLLNANIARLIPFLPTPITGICDALTIALIEEFQGRVMGVMLPDGRVDPKGNTLARLNGGSTDTTAVTEPVLDGNALPAPAAKVLKQILKQA